MSLSIWQSRLRTGIIYQIQICISNFAIKTAKQIFFFSQECIQSEAFGRTYPPVFHFFFFSLSGKSSNCYPSKQGLGNISSTNILSTSLQASPLLPKCKNKKQKKAKQMVVYSTVWPPGRSSRSSRSIGGSGSQRLRHRNPAPGVKTEIANQGPRASVHPWGADQGLGLACGLHRSPSVSSVRRMKQTASATIYKTGLARGWPLVANANCHCHGTCGNTYRVKTSAFMKF